MENQGPGCLPPGIMETYAVPPAASPHAYPNTTYTIILQPTTTTSVVVVGGCPAWQSRSPGRHFHLSRRLLRDRLFPYRNSFLPRVEATEMPQLRGDVWLRAPSMTQTHRGFWGAVTVCRTFSPSRPPPQCKCHVQSR
ncbi:membrane protein BRI3 isoform X2 [Heteronotia binoei]|uniref:membrane protein BRI3 isoform X2 n=1 Tax=Heteronotia binoei TaxID=13085 RepID=UPI00292EFAFB|nr:membrane protein BRI3 isoform X2 [Heteronotia binoei]